MKKLALLGVAVMSLSLLGGCGSSKYSTRLPDYSEYVTIGEYTGLGYTPQEISVTDDDVQGELDSFVEDHATENEITDRGAQVGDNVNIDYVGTVDGVEFEGGNTDGKGTDITVGESGYIDGFDDQIVGMKTGETKEIKVTFPDPYKNNTDLSGKDAVFKTTMNKITETITPELTDQLVADNTDCKTIDEYKEELRDKLTKDAEQDALDDARDQLIAAAAKNAKFSAYPEDEIKKLIDDTVSQIKSTASSYGIDYATYLQYFYQCETEEDFDKYLSDSAKEYMEQRMTVCEIAKKEKVTVSDDDIKAYAEDLVEQYSLKSTDDVYKYYTEADLEYMILAERIGDLLKKSAVEVEATTEDDAADVTDEDTTDTTEETSADTTEEASDSTAEATSENSTSDATAETTAAE